jgi:hypothetical protein
MGLRRSKGHEDAVRKVGVGRRKQSACPTSAPCTTRPENLRSLRRFVGRTPWSGADAPVGPVLVAAMLLCGAGAFTCQPNGPGVFNGVGDADFQQPLAIGR